jgi:hypothetical protein
MSLRTCKNFLPIVHGALVNRPGTYDLGAGASVTVRAKEFIFSDAQAFTLEFTDSQVRFWTPSGVVAVAGVPYSVATPYVAGDLARLKFCQVGDVIRITHPSYQPRELTRVSNTNWTLSLVSTTPQAYFGTTRVLPGGLSTGPATASLVIDNLYLIPKNAQFGPTGVFDPAHAYAVNDQVLLANAFGSYTQYISLAGANTGHQPDQSPTWWAIHSWDNTGAAGKPTWSKGDFVFFKGILYISLADANVNQDPTAANSIYWARADDASHPTFRAGWVVTQVWQDQYGRSFETLPSTAFVSPYGGKFPRYPDRPPTLSWGDPNAALAPASYVLLGHFVYFGADGVYGLIGSTDAITTTFSDTGEAPDFGTQPPKGTNPFDYATGAATKTQSWPGASTFHDQRWVAARSDKKPDHFFGSKVGSVNNFDVTLPVPQDADAFDWRVSDEKLQEIRSIVSSDQLCLFCGQGEFISYGPGDGQITPNAVRVKKQSENGSSYLDPLKTEHAILYNTAKGNTIRDFVFDFGAGKYVGVELSDIARHLFKGRTIVSWAHQRVPYHLVWIVLDNGALLSLTYDRGSQTVAFAQHPRAGSVLQVSCIPNGTEDALLLWVSRNGGVRVELLAERDNITDVRLACFLDGAARFDGRITDGSTMKVSGATYNAGDIVTVDASIAKFVTPTDIGDQIVILPDGIAAVLDDEGAVITPAVLPTRITVTAFVSATEVTGRMEGALPAAFQNVPAASWGWARDTISGLDHLEGLSVNVLADGVVQGPFVVAGGQVQLNPPGLIVTAGLGYNSDAELLDVASDAARTNQKNIEQVVFEVVASRGIFAGQDFSHLRPAKTRKVSDNFGAPALITDQVPVKVDASWNTGGRAVVRQSDPLPLMITGVTRHFEAGGPP